MPYIKMAVKAVNYLYAIFAYSWVDWSRMRKKCAGPVNLGPVAPPPAHATPTPNPPHPTPLPTKAYTTLVPKFEKHPFSRILGEKNTPFSTEIAEFEAQYKNVFIIKIRFFVV